MFNVVLCVYFKKRTLLWFFIWKLMTVINRCSTIKLDNNWLNLSQIIVLQLRKFWPKFCVQWTIALYIKKTLLGFIRKLIITVLFSGVYNNLVRYFSAYFVCDFQQFLLKQVILTALPPGHNAASSSIKTRSSVDVKLILFFLYFSKYS